jgi:hypothetical protein
MGNAYQTPLGFDLLEPPQVEPAEAHIVFDVTEDRFDFDIAQDAQGLASLREQIGFGLFSEATQAETDPHMTIALRLSTFWFEWASVAARGFIVTHFYPVTIIRFFMTGIAVGQALVSRANELVCLGIIG